MSYNIINLGSLSDALSAFRTDLSDTVNNILGVVDNLTQLAMSCDDPSVAVDTTQFPLRLVYNDENITLVKESDGYNVYNGLNDKVGLLIDNDGVEHYLEGYSLHDMLAYSNSSLASNELLLETCDLALVNDDPDQDISAMLGSKYGPMAATLSSGTKEALDNIQTYMLHTDRGPTGVAGFLSELYTSLQDVGVDDTGKYYYRSSDKAWHIQGFVGSYVVRAVATAAVTVIASVVTVVAPIIGMAVSLLVGAFSKLKDLFLNFTSSEAHINGTVTNNMVNMSMIDYDLPSSSLPSLVASNFSANPGTNAVTYRLPQSTWIFTRPVDGVFHLQIMCNVEYSMVSNYGAGVADINNHTFTTIKYTDTLPVSYTGGTAGYFANCTRVYNNYTTQDVDSSAWDARVRTSFMCAYTWIMGLAASTSLGNNVTTSVSTSMPGSTAPIAQHAYWTHTHRSSSDVSWSQIVSYRNGLRATNDLGTLLCAAFQNFIANSPAYTPTGDVVYAMQISFQRVSKFFAEVPSYTGGAVWRSILLVAAVGAVAVTTAVGICKIRNRVRQFMLKKQTDVEAKKYVYENAALEDKDAAWNDYWNGMKSYNRWTTLTRYDKFDLSSGLIVSKSDEAQNGSYGINLKQIKTISGDTKEIDLTDIYRLIAGTSY